MDADGSRPNVREDPIQGLRHAGEVEGVDERGSGSDLPAAAGPEESPELVLERPSLPPGLLLECAERSKLALRLDDPLHRGCAHGPDQLVLQVRDAHVEPQGFHVGATEVRAEPGSLEGSAEIPFLRLVAQARQPHVEPSRAEHVEEARDVLRSPHRHDGDRLGVEVSPATFGQTQEREPVAHPLDQHDGARKGARGCLRAIDSVRHLHVTTVSSPAMTDDENPSGPLQLTGERTLPGVRAENYWFRRHEAAYGVAAERAHGRILDVGCGEGYGAAMLSSTGAVTAMELDPLTASHAALTYPGLRVMRADACRIPFRRAAFDAVVAMQVLEHLWCPEGFVDQVRGLLGPGGVLVLSTPNRETFSPNGVVNPYHSYEYTAVELADLLATSFSDIEVHGVRHGLYLRSLDVLAEGSLQHLLMRTPYEDLPGKLRTGVDLVRADHFTLGPAEGAHDLFAVATT
jgi:SAM-dependent methyltransferase